MAQKYKDSEKVSKAKEVIDKILGKIKQSNPCAETVGMAIDELTGLYAIMVADNHDPIALAVVKGELVRDVLSARVASRNKDGK